MPDGQILSTLDRPTLLAAPNFARDHRTAAEFRLTARQQNKSANVQSALFQPAIESLQSTPPAAFVSLEDRLADWHSPVPSPDSVLPAKIYLPAHSRL